MYKTDKIKTAFARQTKALRLRPGIGVGTAVTKLQAHHGLSCEVTEGLVQFKVDVNEKWGGGGTGPNPGTYGRTALASCLAIAYLSWAARLDVPLNNLSIEVQADYDTRGFCDLDDKSALYTEVRYLVSVESPLPETKVLAALDKAELHCTYFQIFDRALKTRRILRLNGKEIQENERKISKTNSKIRLG